MKGNKIVEHLGRAVKANTSYKLDINCTGWWVQLPQMLHFCIDKPQLINQEKKELIKVELRHFYYHIILVDLRKTKYFFLINDF